MSTSLSAARRELAEDLERPLDVVVGERLVFVEYVFDNASLERAAAGQLEEPEAAAALDDDVHAPVVERLDQRRNAGARPDLVHRAVAGGEQEPELAVRLEAFANEFVVARLEDVQRDPLGRDEDDR